MTEWIANSSSAWGRGWNKYDSLAKLAGSAEIGEDIEVTFYEVISNGDWNITPSGVVCEDSVLVSEETVTIEGKHMEEIKDLSTALELQVEQALVEAQQ